MIVASLEGAEASSCYKTQLQKTFNQGEIGIFEVSEFVGPGELATDLMDIATAKAKVLTNKLSTKQSQSMRGLYAQLDMHDFTAPDIRSKVQACKGLPQTKEMLAGLRNDFAPCVVTFRAGCACHGASAWPLCGVGCFVVPVAGCVRLTALDIGLLRAKGKLLAFDGLANALDTRPLRGHVWPKLGLLAGTIAWLPYGMYPIPISMEAESSILVVPWLSAGLAKPLGSDTSGLIEGGILAFARMNEARPPWAHLCPAFRPFADQTKF